MVAKPNWGTRIPHKEGDPYLVSNRSKLLTILFFMHEEST